jgi:hypothetical protein
MVDNSEADSNLRSKWMEVILTHFYVSDGSIQIRENDWMISHYHTKIDLSTIE